MAANYEKYLNDFVETLKFELNKYYITLKKIPEIDCKTFFKPENLISIKERFYSESKKVIDNVIWNDMFIMIVCMIHVLILFNIIQDRGRYFKQILYVICLILLSFSSNYLNQLGTENWSKFAAKNYFDEEGKFMLLFLNIPVFIELGLCLVFISILSLIYLCSGNKKSKKSKSGKKSVAKKPKPEPKKPVSKDSQLKGNVKKPYKKAPVKKFN
ncbi:hypothetical protein LY90DRAFT_662978 [Neocallimastix californiae]|uniref:Uncharacterized protein n=1 Tax=Neocallimastix californiae TaxID=1754190 RepID=A0A1Y2FTI4_9FUNG|nr:hypothetical protein LY90DRAFT_662978 [Neocallimastix californiae]|eukprot:ORY87259.1 hypothetical protein LY90DRAFT_662978 [Neocallimastix californiae]